MPSSLYRRLSTSGTFVVVTPPRLEFVSGQSWLAVVPHSVHTTVGRALRKAHQAVNGVFLPVSLGGLWFLPNALASELAEKAKLWIKAYSEARRIVEEHDSALLQLAVAEKVAGLARRCHRSGRPRGFSTGEIERQGAMLAKQEFVAEPPSICPVSVGVGRSLLAQSVRCSFNEAVCSFVMTSYTEVLRLMVLALNEATVWACLFQHCTDEVYRSRGYYRKRLYSLPLDRWVSWLETFGDESTSEMISNLRASLPSRDPGRRKAISACKRVSAVASDLERLVSHGTIVPSILRSVDAVLQ